MALIAIPAFASGKGAQLMLHGKPDISDDFMQRHEGAAMLACGSWRPQGFRVPVVAAASPARMGVEFDGCADFFVVDCGIHGENGEHGGEISHTEVRASQEATPTEGTWG